jgi:hypothetical protein
MFDQLIESFRTATESSLQMQQDMFKQWTQQWRSAQPNAGATSDWGRAFDKRWLQFTVDALNKHRESLDTAYKSGIQVIEQSFRVADAKSTDDYKRMVEELWHKLFDTFKTQAESQFRDFQVLAEKSFETARSAEAQS